MYATKRKDLLSKIKDPNLSYEEKQMYRLKLEKLPRNSNPNRVRNRCNLTGRPRAYYRRFNSNYKKLVSIICSYVIVICLYIFLFSLLFYFTNYYLLLLYIIFFLIFNFYFI